MTTNRYGKAAPCALLCALLAGCGDGEVIDPTGVTYPSDYYAYSYYYPADLAYSVPYYVDDWYDYPYLYSNPQALVDASGQTVGALLRRLAAGEELCPGQVEIEPETTEVDCGGEIRSGAEIEFEGCELDDGGRLDGSVDLTSARAFSSDDCGPDTVVTVTTWASYEGLVFTEPGGERVAVPTLTSAGSYTRLLDDRPVAVSMTSSGSFERYDSSGALVTQVDLSGSQGVVIGAPSDSWLYRVYGPLAIDDARSGRSLSLSSQDLVHEPGCCHPVAGSMLISSGAGAEDVLAFGPDCGRAFLNDEAVNLPACP